MWLAALLTPSNAARWLGGAAAVVGFGLAFFYGWEIGTMLLFGAGMVVLGGSFLLEAYLALKARSDAVAFARRTGWTYHPRLTGLLAPLGTAPFGIADASYTDVVTGFYGGLECWDGVYTWRVRIDDAEVRGSHRVAVVRLPDELPRLKIVPEGMAGRLAKALGGRDRDFESAAFNREWRVLADNDRVAHDMLSPRVLQRLTSLGITGPMVFEAGLGVRIDDATEGIASIVERLGGLVVVAKFLPEHTIADFGRFANSPGPLPSVAEPGGLTKGYDPERLRRDEEFLRSAQPRKATWRAGRADRATELPTPSSPQQ